MVTGHWERAVTQLSVSGGNGRGALPWRMRIARRFNASGCAREVFAGKRSPLVFGEPEPWIAALLQALALDRGGHAAEAAEAARQALEAAPATAERSTASHSNGWPTRIRASARCSKCC